MLESFERYDRYERYNDSALLPMFSQGPSFAADNRRIWRAFRHHSRTFSLTARLLPERVQIPIATVYLYCRTVDNLADRTVLDVGPQRALEALSDVRSKLSNTLAGNPPRELLWQRLHLVDFLFDLPRAPLFELIEGAEWDLQGRPIESRQELIEYSNLVAGSVGEMMLPFLLEEGQDAERLAELARMLGIAMQLTNIARDVGEDWRVNRRVYIPRRWLDLYHLRPEDLAGPALPPGYSALMEDLMTTSESLYERSFAGIDALPGATRRGIRAAACLYREIMNVVRGNGYDNLSRRAFVPGWRKLALLLNDGYGRRKERLLARSTAAAPLHVALQTHEG